MFSYILEIKDISKSFNNIKVLKNISLKLKKGEVHAILGENGAGKSTLIKILLGVYKHDCGLIKLHGKKITFNSPLEAYKNGLCAVFQETSLIENFSIIDNIFLGIESKYFWGIIDKKQMLTRYNCLCNSLGFYLHPYSLIKNLSLSQKKIVEIMKCLVRNSEIIILDEPTDVLSDKETNFLFSIINKLKKKSITFIYITHYLTEVFKIAERATILKDGKSCGTLEIKDTNEENLFEMIAGEELKQDLIQQTKNNISTEIFRVEKLHYYNKVNNVSFQLYKGEILGITGLLGCGKTELALLIFGELQPKSGKLFLNESEVFFSSPRTAISSGIALIPEDRDSLSLIQNQSVIKNFTLSSLHKYVHRILISHQSEKKAMINTINKFDIKVSSFYQNVFTLSGGNKQKLVIGKWLDTDPDIILLDEPTRGIDLKSKHSIYKIIRNLAAKGKSIIIFSTDIPEIVGLSDRVMIMKKGKITNSFNKNITEKKIYKSIFKDTESV